MIVTPPPLSALARPATNVAMGFWIWVDIESALFGNRCLGSGFHTPEEGGEISEPEALRFEVRPWRHDMDVIWRPALHVLQQVGVEAKLQHGPALCLSGQLGVDNLI